MNKDLLQKMMDKALEFKERLPKQTEREIAKDSKLSSYYLNLLNEIGEDNDIPDEIIKAIMKDPKEVEAQIHNYELLGKELPEALRQTKTASLRFATQAEALQYLADKTGKKIKIAVHSFAAQDVIEALKPVKTLIIKLRDTMREDGKEQEADDAYLKLMDMMQEVMNELKKY